MSDPTDPTDNTNPVVHPVLPPFYAAYRPFLSPPTGHDGQPCREAALIALSERLEAVTGRLEALLGGMTTNSHAQPANALTSEEEIHGIDDFLWICTERDANVRTSASAIYAAYLSYCEAIGRPKLGRKMFGVQMNQRGYPLFKANLGYGTHIKVHTGIRLKKFD